MTMSKPGPLQPLAQSIRGVLAETGAVLADMGASTLGELVVGALDDMAAKGCAPLAPGSWLAGWPADWLLAGWLLLPPPAVKWFSS
jgi:hypothetical protein